MARCATEHRLVTIIGANLRAARLAAGVSQVELGAALGLSFQQIQKYENGANRISAARLLLVAHVLQTPLADLYRPGVE
jgi:transcriptional regulator with XRE-family HTH domain